MGTAGPVTGADVTDPQAVVSNVTRTSRLNRNGFIIWPLINMRFGRFALCWTLDNAGIDLSGSSYNARKRMLDTDFPG